MNDTSSQKRWRCTAQLRVSLRARRQRIRTLSFCAARRARYAAVEAILYAFSVHSQVSSSARDSKKNGKGKQPPSQTLHDVVSNLDQTVPTLGLFSFFTLGFSSNCAQYNWFERSEIIYQAFESPSKTNIQLE